jgi:Animal haem peroxidase
MYDLGSTVQETIGALREVYGDDIEACDLLIGNLAEKKIPGFAISETSFHIFVLLSFSAAAHCSVLQNAWPSA